MERAGSHEKHIAAHFEQRVVYRGEGACLPFPLAVVCFTNRCGSMLLADYLRLAGSFAGLQEQLSWPYVGKLSSRNKWKSFPEYIAGVATANRGNALVFGFKASWEQLVMLLRWRVDRMFTSLCVVHIERRDVVAQAVSYWIAQQTSQWTSRQRGKPTEPEYSFREINARVVSISNGNAAIRRIASVYALPVHLTVYEELIEHPLAEIERIHRRFGLAMQNTDLSASNLVKQGNAVNEHFIERYRREAAEELHASA